MEETQSHIHAKNVGKKYANKANVSRHKKKAHGKVAPYNNVKGKKNKGKSKATKKKVVGKKKG